MIGVKLVFKSKYNNEKLENKHKAWLVAKGYAQRLKVDFDDTFAPMTCISTIRTILALAGKKQCPIFHMDVKLAFLNGDLKEEVYVG